MSSRDAILSRIRAALAADPPLAPPPVPEVWPRENPSTEQKLERFIAELEAVAGEGHVCASIEAARQKLNELLDQLGPGTIGAIDHPLTRDLAAELPPDRVDWGSTEVDRHAMGRWPASIVPADCLLADTGTVMVVCATTHERLMCYLPPACIAIAKTGRLFEHMPAAWDEIAPRAAEADRRGEFVFITGPSRTADIEKILILGVHGPKRLIVLLVD